MKFCGISTSDSKYLRCAASLACPVCRPAGTSVHGRLGLGYYSGQEILLTRRPVSSDFGVLPFLEPAMGNHVLLAFEDGSGAPSRLEDTPPRRFRNYLGMVATGGFFSRDFAERVRFHLPGYLARDLRGDTPGDLLFHLLLSYLHDSGHLESPRMPVAMLLDAVRSTLLLLPRLLDTAAAPPVALCVSNGQHLVAGSVATDLWMRVLDGIEACPVCSEFDRAPDRDPTVVSHPGVRVVAFAHVDCPEPPAGFARVSQGQVVAATDAGELVTRGL